MVIEDKHALYIPKVGDIVIGTVVSVNDTEVLVDVNYSCEGVIYSNHLTPEKIQSAKDIVKVGDQIKVKVTQFRTGENGDSLLLSRLDVLRQEKIEKHRDELEVDKDYEFLVKKNVKGGLILDYHGIEAFLPESLIFLKDENQEKQDLKGKTIKARIIEISQKGRNERIIANRKQLVYEAQKAEQDAEFNVFEVNQIVKGKVVRITQFGAFVALGEHTDGLVHISEISHYMVKKVEDFLNVGDEIEAKIIKIKGRRISLSIKALLETPWQLFLKNHKVGEKVIGKVVRKMQYGMLIEVEREITGLLNRFDYSWNPQENLAGTVEVGSEIEVEITSINKDKEQFTLSRKHLEYNPWADLKLKKGELVSAEVTRIEEKGAIVEIEGVEGYLPIGELSSNHVQRVDEIVKTDDVITVEVLQFYPKDWKLIVSLKSVQEKRARKEYEKQLEENVSSTQSLADLFREYKK